MLKDATEILRNLSEGRGDAAEQLFPLVYDELRALAARCLRHERGNHTLQPTALVHEAFLKLTDQAVMAGKEREHFVGIAARAMRQVLVDYARRHLAAKRGGGAAGSCSTARLPRGNRILWTSWHSMKHSRGSPH